MNSDQFEIIDVHLHAWPAEGMGAAFAPHAPATSDERVFKDTLANVQAYRKPDASPTLSAQVSSSVGE
jgi:hypothetical protein